MQLAARRGRSPSPTASAIPPDADARRPAQDGDRAAQRRVKHRRAAVAGESPGQPTADETVAVDTATRSDRRAGRATLRSAARAVHETAAWCDDCRVADRVNFALLYRTPKEWRISVGTPQELACGALRETPASGSFEAAVRES